MISLPPGCGAVDEGEWTRGVDGHGDELHLLKLFIAHVEELRTDLIMAPPCCDDEKEIGLGFWLDEGSEVPLCLDCQDNPSLAAQGWRIGRWEASSWGLALGGGPSGGPQRRISRRSSVSPPSLGAKTLPLNS